MGILRVRLTRRIETRTHMKKHPILLSTVLLVLALGVLTPQFAQDASTKAEKTDQEEFHRALGMGLVRAINTAEVGELSKYGSYAAWPTLLGHQQEYFNGWLSRFYAQEVNPHFADMPEFLPGYSLRLNVHADGQGYDLRLQDTTAKPRYAAFSDESGVIWQGEPLH
jgi:hypothetical protein